MTNNKENNEEWKETLKSFKVKLADITKENDIFIVPLTLWAEIINKIEYFESELKSSRKKRDFYKTQLSQLKKDLRPTDEIKKSRDRWKNRYKELKTKLLHIKHNE